MSRPDPFPSLSCAAIAGALSIALPEIVDLWHEERKNRRNGLSFLLRLSDPAVGA
jgi:hypothetical protein